MLELEVPALNERARSLYERWGFAPAEITLAANIDTLVERLRSTDEREDQHSVTKDPSASDPSLRFAEIAACQHSATSFDERHSRTKAIAQACSPTPTHSNSPPRSRRAESVSPPSRIESSASQRWS
jgi:hypothetical protein